MRLPRRGTGRSACRVSQGDHGFGLDVAQQIQHLPGRIFLESDRHVIRHRPDTGEDRLRLRLEHTGSDLGVVREDAVEDGLSRISLPVRLGGDREGGLHRHRECRRLTCALSPECRDTVHARADDGFEHGNRRVVVFENRQIILDHCLVFRGLGLRLRLVGMTGYLKYLPYFVIGGVESPMNSWVISAKALMDR